MSKYKDALAGAAGSIALSVAPVSSRGDVDADGQVNFLTDMIYLMDFGFMGGADPPCLATADVDGNQVLNPLIDALHGLNAGFAAGPHPPAPYPDCGSDLEGVAEFGCLEPPVCPE